MSDGRVVGRHERGYVQGLENSSGRDWGSAQELPLSAREVGIYLIRLKDIAEKLMWVALINLLCWAALFTFLIVVRVHG